MEADDPRLVQHMFDVETDGVPSHATIAALTVEHLDRVVAERTAERDALQARIDTAQDVVRDYRNGAMPDMRTFVARLDAALGVDPQKEVDTRD